MVLTEQGYEALAAGQYEDAVQSFSAALTMQPNEAQAVRGRGLAHVALKQWASATADFETMRRLVPDDLESWCDLGVCLAMSYQPYAALEIFETLLTQHPAYARGHLQIGLHYLRLGAIPKGREHLERALACRPTPEERRLIDATLHEQARLDRKRYYRPDFEMLHRQQRLSPSWWRQWLRGHKKQVAV